MTTADVQFHFDPVCPFAWLTSRWVDRVATIRGYSVDWRFISLRLLNADVDYDTHFPRHYEHGHTAGLRMLRVAAKARAEHGSEVVGPLYTAMGAATFDIDRPEDPAAYGMARGTREAVEPMLIAAGLPTSLADALDDASWDAAVSADTEAALDLTGRDVGTPIIQFAPPEGPAFFGPVISRVPDDDDAVRLWDTVVSLATFPGFAELKRSLREPPALRVYGRDPEDVDAPQDWKAGHLADAD